MTGAALLQARSDVPFRGLFRAALAGMWLVLLGGLLPWFLLAGLDNARLSLPSLAAGVIVVYAAARLAALVWVGTPRVLELTFWIYVYVWLGLAALLQVSVDRYPWPGAYNEGSAVSALLKVLIGIGMYEVGLTIRAGSLQRLGDRVLGRRITWARSLPITLLALGTATALLLSLGGVSAVLVSRTEFQAFLQLGADQPKAVGMLIKAGLSLPAFVALLATLVLWVERKHQSKWLKVALGLALCVLIPLNLIVNNPLYSPRAWVGTIVLSCVFAASRWRRDVSPSLWVGGLLMLFVVLFPYTDIFRQSTLIGGRLEFGEEVSRQLVRNGDYASFQQLLNVERYVHEEGLQLGQQAVGTLLVWIPRSAWPGKPVSTGELVATHAGYSYTTLEMPLWGELYIDGGWLALGLGFLFYGWLTEMLERAIKLPDRRRDNLGTVLMATLVGYQVLIIRGDLMSNLMWLGVTILIFVAASTPVSRARRGSPILEWRDGSGYAGSPRSVLEEA